MQRSSVLRLNLTGSTMSARYTNSVWVLLCLAGWVTLVHSFPSAEIIRNAHAYPIEYDRIDQEMRETERPFTNSHGLQFLDWNSNYNPESGHDDVSSLWRSKRQADYEYLPPPAPKLPELDTSGFPEGTRDYIAKLPQDERMLINEKDEPYINHEAIESTSAPEGLKEASDKLAEETEPEARGDGETEDGESRNERVPVTYGMNITGDKGYVWNDLNGRPGVYYDVGNVDKDNQEDSGNIPVPANGNDYPINQNSMPVPITNEPTEEIIERTENPVSTQLLTDSKVTDTAQEISPALIPNESSTEEIQKMPTIKEPVGEVTQSYQEFVDQPKEEIVDDRVIATESSLIPDLEHTNVNTESGIESLNKESLSTEAEHITDISEEGSTAAEDRKDATESSLIPESSNANREGEIEGIDKESTSTEAEKYVGITDKASTNTEDQNSATESSLIPNLEDSNVNNDSYLQGSNIHETSTETAVEFNEAQKETTTEQAEFEEPTTQCTTQIPQSDEYDETTHLVEDVALPNPPDQETEKRSEFLETLLHNDQFWQWLGDWASLYMQTFSKHINDTIKQEVAAQMASDKLSPIRQPLFDFYHNTKTRKDRKRPNNVADQNASKVEAENVFGNSVGNEKVTNVFIFYPKDGVDKMIEDLKPEESDKPATEHPAIPTEANPESAGSEQLLTDLLKDQFSTEHYNEADLRISPAAVQ